MLPCPQDEENEENKKRNLNSLRVFRNKREVEKDDDADDGDVDGSDGETDDGETEEDERPLDFTTSTSTKRIPDGSGDIFGRIRKPDLNPAKHIIFRFQYR